MRAPIGARIFSLDIRRAKIYNSYSNDWIA